MMLNLIILSLRRAVKKFLSERLMTILSSVSNKLYVWKTVFQWFKTLMPSGFHALLYLVAFKFNVLRSATGLYKGTKFRFFKRDMSALKEVLVDEEYSFLNVSSAQKPSSSFTVLDVGAHIGTFGMWLLSEVPGAHIMSVEASPATFSTTAYNAQRFDSEHNQWRVIQRAAWKNNDVLKFSNEGDSMGFKVAKDGDDEVVGISFADLLRESGFDRVSLMKIDVEGAEEQFLAASGPLLSRVDQVVIEIHPLLCDEGNVRDVLQQAFDHVIDIQGRVSSKPLLHCYRD